MRDLPVAGRPKTRRRQVVVIVALVALVGCPSLFTRDLWNPDEPRYMEVAREMVVLGEYLVPHLNGEVYSQKPPVWFWAAAGLWKLGLGYNSGRIVTLLAVTATLLLLWDFTHKEADLRAALPAVAIALTTAFLTEYAKEGVLDPMLMLFTTAALVSGYRAFRPAETHPMRLWSLAYAAMACGTLTKGPVGTLVPGLVLLAYGLINRKYVQGAGCAHLVGAGVYVACLCAWLVPAIVSGGQEYAQTILIRQNIGRAVGSWSHRNPVYYYLDYLPWQLLPWTLLLLPACLSAFRLWRRENDSASLFALLWLVVPVVFFSLMSGKRGRYLLPIVPAVGFLCARYLILPHAPGLRFPRTEKWSLRAGLVIIALVASAIVASFGLVTFHPGVQTAVLERAEGDVAELVQQLVPLRVIPGMALVAVPAAVAAVGLLSVKSSSLRLAGALVASVLVLSVALDLTAVPFLNPAKSGRQFGQKVSRLAGGSATVYLFGTDYSGMYNLYSDRVRMPVLREADDLRQALGREGTFVIGDGERLARALEKAEVGRYAVYRERIGHRMMLLLSGRKDGDERRGQHP